MKKKEKEKVYSTRRENNSGSIFQTKNGKWVAQITLNERSPKTGRKRLKQFYFNSKQEAKEKLTEAQYEIQKGIFKEPKKILLKDFLKNWLENKKPFLAENTWRTYELLIRQHIRPSLGRIKLENLKKTDIQNLINQKITEGKLSPRTIKYIHTTLSTALSQAVSDRILTFNEADGINLPKQQRKELKTFSPEQIKIFLSTAESYQYYIAFLTAFNTGMRLSEILGLKWEDINFNEKNITVKRQVERKKGKGLILKDFTKTNSGFRRIPITNDFSLALKKHKKKQNELKLRLGEYYYDLDLVISIPEGKPVDPTNLSSSFRRILKRTDLPHFRFHDIRHSFATLAVKEGINLKALQIILGHSSFSFTMDTYAHVDDEMRLEAGKKINGFMKKSL